MKCNRPSIIHDIEKRQLQYFGHVIRDNSMQRRLMEGVLEGTRCSGRPKNSWTGHMLKILDMDYVSTVCAAQQRGVWRAMAANLLRRRHPT